MTTEQSNAVESTAAIMRDLYKPALLALDPEEGPECALRVAVLPEGLRIESLAPMLDARAPHPLRQQGTIAAHTIDALLAVTDRFARAGTTVYVNVSPAGQGSVLTVFDHHDGQVAGHGQFRVVHELRRHEAFTLWASVHTRWMKQGDFAAFLEDRLMELVAIDASSPLAPVAAKLFTSFADPAAVLLAAKGLSLKIEQEVTNAVTTETGEVSLVFAEKHTRQGGVVEVPKLFAVQCPVWEQGAPYQLPIKLRYRVNNGSVEWNVQALLLDRVVEHATNTLYATVAAGVPETVPVVRGAY